CPFHAGRRSEPWSDDVAEVTQSRHHLRTIHALVLDACDWIVGIGLRGLLLLLRQRRRRRNDKDDEQHYGCIAPNNHDGVSSKLGNDLVSSQRSLRISPFSA